MDIIKTGSISQDALRLGFQTTCNKGVATLLKVDDITVEECSAFKERHITALNERMKNFSTEKANKASEEFKEYSTVQFNFNNVSCFRWVTIFKQTQANKQIMRQAHRTFTVSDIQFSEPYLSVEEGRWRTTIKYKLTRHAWTGWYRREIKSFEEETDELIEVFSTNARKCAVQYIPYDHYNATYIPDDAVEAAYEAKSIGMEKLAVAIPKVENIRGAVKRDPIIVGFVGEQMFVIAWFGYDKTNHMACNV